MPCLVTKRSVWTGRILMEAKLHKSSCFITLTYADKYLPAGGHLKKSDLQNFFKRLRRCIEPLKIRYFAVGEYGTKKSRPHYHGVIFGLDSEYLIRILPIVWKLGSSEPNSFKPFGDLTEKNARYCAGYVTKKMHSDARGSRPKEFQLSSREPAIGDLFVEKIANIWKGSGLIPDHILNQEPSNLQEYISNIRGTYSKFLSNTIRIGGKKYPTGTRFNEIILRRLGAEEKQVQFERQLALRRMEENPVDLQEIKDSEILATRIMKKASYKL